MTTNIIKPFRIAVGDDVLNDLKSRLRNTRWPEAELVDDWSQGAPLHWIKEICRYWAEDYDWRRREASPKPCPAHTPTGRAERPSSVRVRNVWRNKTGSAGEQRE
jgi:hypothetical protein